LDHDFVVGEAAEVDGGADADGCADGDGWPDVGEDFADADFVPSFAVSLDLCGEAACALGVVLSERLAEAVGLDVVVGGVVGDHAVGAEVRGECGDAAFHAGDPGLGYAGGGALVELWDDLAFEEVVEGAAFDGVGGGVVGVGLAVADGEAEFGVVGLVPPSVEDGAVEASVHGGLHAGGSGGFHAAAWGVEPDVAALDESAGDVHVVVFEEDDAAEVVAGLGELDELADEFLAGLVGGVAFAGDEELYWSVGVGEERFEAVLVSHEEGAAFVGGESSGEADGEDVGAERAGGVVDVVWGGAACEELLAEACADPGDHELAGVLSEEPELFVGYVEDAAPEVVVGGVELPVWSDVAVVELDEFGADPGAWVDAVGDGADGGFFDGEAGPDVGPHFAADDAVELGDAVGELAATEGEDRHGEELFFVEGVRATE